MNFIIIIIFILQIKCQLYVNENGNDNNNYNCTFQNSCKSLKKAIFNSNNENNKIYISKEYEEINVIDKSVFIISTNLNNTKLYGNFNLFFKNENLLNNFSNTSSLLLIYFENIQTDINILYNTNIFLIINNSNININYEIISSSLEIYNSTINILQKQEWFLKNFINFNIYCLNSIIYLNFNGYYFTNLNITIINSIEIIDINIMNIKYFSKNSIRKYNNFYFKYGSLEINDYKTESSESSESSKVFESSESSKAFDSSKDFKDFKSSKVFKSFKVFESSKYSISNKSFQIDINNCIYSYNHTNNNTILFKDDKIYCIEIKGFNYH